MNQPNGHGKCGKCDKTLKSEAEKQEHAKTCGTKETVTPTNAKAVASVPVVATATVAKAPVAAAAPAK